MSIAIAKGDEELAVINLSLLAHFGWKKIWADYWISWI